jgi:hypothetical protein
MTRGVRWYLVGSLALVALTGCKPTWFEEREPWRHEAEMSCLKSGAVKENASVALLGPISGPGVCGADFPLKVGALGEDAPLSYADEALRPPGDVPQSGYPSQPSDRTPPTYRSAPQYPPHAPFAVNPNYPADTRLPPRPDYRASPSYPPQQYPANAPFAVNRDYPADTRLPPRADYPPPTSDYEPAPPYPGANRYPPPRPYESAPYSRGPSVNAPISLTPPGVERPHGDAAGDMQAPTPPYRSPPRVPFPSRYPGSGEVVPLSPAGPASIATTASLSPPATLACPLVSTLDRWITDAVQPAAQKWFGQPVTAIKQISAYSCRGMNGNPNAHISEHAFGNALDIASFTLADGHTVTVEHGWRGMPEEQGFLRDVQAAACEVFTTVLAPGSNVYHYNHIHVDLMRRASGRRICEPNPIGGDAVAARVRARYGSRADPGITGSIPERRGGVRRNSWASAYGEEGGRRLPDAVPGED